MARKWPNAFLAVRLYWTLAFSMIETRRVLGRRIILMQERL